MGYPTPDSAPTGTRCVSFSVPAGEEWERLVRGALASLFLPWSFETLGSYTPDETAEEFNQSMADSMEWAGCAVSGLIVGEIRTIAAFPVPAGWLFCDGSLLLIANYPALYDAIGTVFGGNGTTNFNLPDLRGRFVVGYGSGVGLSEYLVGDTGGEENHLLTVDEIPAHSHVVPNFSSSVAFQSGTDRTALRNTPGINTTTSSVGGGASHENRPPYIALAHYIYAGT